MLSAIGSSMIATGRNDVALARNLRAAAIAMAAADGAVEQAAFHILSCAGKSDCAGWPTSGAPIDASRDGVAIAVCLTDEAGKINPNRANAAIMAALLAALDVPAADSARLADAIVGWRTAEADPAVAAARADRYRQAGLPDAPAGQPFAAIDDLRAVIGMTPAIFDRLRPNVSIWNQADPDPALASPATRLALRAAPALFSIAGAQTRTIDVTATATIARGAQFTRAATISLEHDPAKAPLRILSWAAAPHAPC